MTSITRPTATPTSPQRSSGIPTTATSTIPVCRREARCADTSSTACRGPAREGTTRMAAVQSLDVAETVVADAGFLDRHGICLFF